MISGCADNFGLDSPAPPAPPISASAFPTCKSVNAQASDNSAPCQAVTDPTDLQRMKNCANSQRILQTALALHVLAFAARGSRQGSPEPVLPVHATVATLYWPSWHVMSVCSTRERVQSAALHVLGPMNIPIGLRAGQEYGGSHKAPRPACRDAAESVPPAGVGRFAASRDCRSSERGSKHTENTKLRVPQHPRKTTAGSLDHKSSVDRNISQPELYQVASLHILCTTYTGQALRLRGLGKGLVWVGMIGLVLDVWHIKIPSSMPLKIFLARCLTGVLAVSAGRTGPSGKTFNALELSAGNQS